MHKAHTIDLSAFDIVTNDEIPRIRDIWLPIQIVKPEKGKPDIESLTVDGNLESAACWIGETNGRRLHDPSNPASTSRLYNIFGALTEAVREGQDRFRLELDGVAFRAQIGEMIDGHDVSLRALPDHVPHLDDLRMEDGRRALLNSSEVVAGGIFLFVATNGQGKTTTASATIRTRLETWGGVAYTCEDPCELPLTGTFGKGLCVQRTVRAENPNNPGSGYANTLIKTLRQFQAISGGGTMVLIGEIRDAETAAEAIKAGSNGHLVLATMHAKTVANAVAKLTGLAASSLTGTQDLEAARDALAESLAGIFHQRLVWDRTKTGWQAAEIKGDILWVNDPQSAAAEAIRSGNFKGINEISLAQTQALRSFRNPIDTEELMTALRQVRPG